MTDEEKKKLLEKLEKALKPKPKFPTGKSKADAAGIKQVGGPAPKVIDLKPTAEQLAKHPELFERWKKTLVGMDPEDQEMMEDMWEQADDKLPVKKTKIIQHPSALAKTDPDYMGILPEGVDQDLDDAIRYVGPKRGSTEWAEHINAEAPEKGPRFVTKESDPKVYKDLAKRFSSFRKARGGEVLTKIWGPERLEELVEGGGIRPPSELDPLDLYSKHTPIEPIGLYSVDRSGYRYMPHLLYGDQMSNPDEKELNTFGKLLKFFRMSEKGEASTVSRIALDPKARIFDAGNPMHWLGYLDEFGGDLEASGDKIRQAAGKALRTSVKEYIGTSGESLYNTYWRELNRVEKELGEDIFGYVNEQMNVELTDKLRRSYDAVKFPDVVIRDQAHMPQVVVLNKGKAVMRVGKAFMPLSVAFAAAMALMPEQTSASPLDAQVREKELKGKFQASEAVDFQAALQQQFRTPTEEKALQSLAVTKSSQAGDWEKASRAMPVAAVTSINSFVQGAIPLDVVPQVKSVYDAMDNGVGKLALAAGVPKDEMAAKLGGTAGLFYGVGKMFKYGSAGRAWLAGKALPQSIPYVGEMTSLLGKAPLGEKAAALASNAILSAAVGMGYEFGKGEIKTAKQAATTGGIWGGTDLVLGGIGMSTPYMMAGAMATKNWLGSLATRKAAWEAITKAFEGNLEKVPMGWAFGGKYGENLAQYIIPASSRMKKTPEGKTALEEIEQLMTNRYLVKANTEERVAESAKALKNVPEGQRLAYYLMQMDPSDANFWKVLERIKDKHGEEAANTLLTQRAISRRDWTMTGKFAAETPWYTKEEKGPKVWLPKPEAVRSFMPEKPLEEGQSFFTGFYNDEAGKYVLKFSQRKVGSEAIEDKLISTNREFKLLAKTSSIVNKEDLKAAGGWKTSIKYTDVPLLKEETRLKNLETYVPRIFTKHWKDLPADMQLYYQKYKNEPTLFGKRDAINMLGASAARFLKKHNLPQQLVDALEPITDMCVLDYHGLVGARQAVLTARTFDSLSRMPGICMDAQAFRHALANPAPGFKPNDWVKVPNDVNRYFKLAGKHLQRDAFMELESLVLPASDAQGMMHRALIKWKGFKTIWSPRVHVRNSVSNVMLNATVGDYAMPPWGKGWTAYHDMAKIMHNPKDPANAALLKEMAEHKLFMGSFRQADLASISPALDTKVENVFDYVMKGYQHAEAKLAKAYEAEEKWAKGAKYLYLTRHLGVDPKVAAEEAMKSTFNYSDLPLFVKAAREKWWGAPFVTFFYKAVPAMLESAVKYPWRIGAIEASIYAFNATATNALGMQDKEWKELEKRLPSYMAEGHYSPLPGRDKKGRIQWFDTSYLLPWGMIYQIREQTMDRSGARIPLVGDVVLTNPVVSTTMDVMRNEKFNGQPIVHSFDPWPVAMGRVLGHIWEQAVPSLMIGGTDFKSIVDTIRGGEKALTPAQQVARQIGIGVRPMSEEQINRGYVARINERVKDIRSELRQRIQKNPKSTDKEIKKAQKRLRELMGQ